MTSTFARFRSVCFVPIAIAAMSLQAQGPASGASDQGLTKLPGNGLSQHPFLYCGEWDYIHSLQTMHLVQGGKEIWNYSIPQKVSIGGKEEVQEFGDCTRLSNGNILYSRKTGADIITADKKIIWSYNAELGAEVHSVQAIGKDRVLLMQNGNPAKLMLIQVPSGKVVSQIIIPTAHPEKTHGQFRRVRMTKAGTFLAAQIDMNKVVEYDQSGKAIWSVDAPAAWLAVRLKNGNTLITGNQQGYVREVDPKGSIVWEIKKDDLPGFPLAVVQGAERLANGNTILCNWIAGGTKPALWPGTVQVLEVTPDKRVVWAMRQWSDPNLGPASDIQLLDQPGIPENNDRQR